MLHRVIQFGRESQFIIQRSETAKCNNRRSHLNCTAFGERLNKRIKRIGTVFAMLSLPYVQYL